MGRAIDDPSAKEGVFSAVQRGVSSITNGNTSVGVPVAAVDLSRAELRMLGATGDCYIALVDSTTISGARAGTSGTTTFSWELTQVS